MNSVPLLVSLSYLLSLYLSAQALYPPANLTCKEKQEKIRNSNPGRILQWTPNCAVGKQIYNGAVFFGLPETKIHPAFVPDRISSIKRTIPLKPGKTERETKDVQLPKSYNTRDTYRSKCPGVDHVFEQNCGNCWAVASIGVINDRVCMYGKDGVNQTFYSLKQMTSCVEDGCHGGFPGRAFEYWVDKGITTGGNPALHEKPGCLPWPQGGLPNDGTIKGTQCPVRCDDGSNITTKSYGGKAYKIPQNETDIMTEIYLYGPVTAAFTVYSDLYHDYNSGVYKHAYGNRIYGHAVKMIGWGVENGVKYWLIHNSFGESHGEGGFFKIERGTNETGIEAEIETAIPREGIDQ